MSESMMERGMEVVVSILVVGLLSAYLLPVAVTEMTSVDTSSWGDSESALFELLPMFFILAVVIFVVTWAMPSD